MKKKVKLQRPQQINEAKRSLGMSADAMKWHRRLLKILRDHKHATYAECLENFKLEIIYLANDPGYNPKEGIFNPCTAAISFEDGVIYIGEGFILDESLENFEQLNVLIRHELLHNLLMHEVRMSRRLAEKYGDEVAEHFKYSQTIHRFLNIVMDDEISNEKYTSADKNIVRNMTLLGELIGGLVTEDHRTSWMSMSVEEMFDALSAEINNLNQKLQSKVALTQAEDKDFINNEITNAFIYTDTTSPCKLRVPLSKYIGSSLYKEHSPLFQKILSDIYEGIIVDPPNRYERDDIEQFKTQIAQSDPLTPVTLLHKDGTTLVKIFTPEEKWWAMQALKSILMYWDQYHEWYEKVMGVLGTDKYSEDDIKAVLSGIKK